MGLGNIKMYPHLRNAWVGSKRSKQLQHIQNVEHQEHGNEDVPGYSGMSALFLVEHRYLREEQATQVNHLLANLTFLNRSPDLDLVKNQIDLAQIFDELGLQTKMPFPPKMISLWLLPVYTKGQTVLHPNLPNMECHRLSPEEDSIYLSYQVYNIIRHDSNGFGLHSVKPMTNSQDLVDIIQDFTTAFPFHLPVQIVFLGHGAVSNNTSVYYFDDKDVPVTEILAFLDSKFDFVSCLSKPKIVLAFCQAHLCDPTQYVHIQVEMLTSEQSQQTRIVFDTNQAGQILADTIIHEQLVSYTAFKLRQEMEQIVQTCCGPAADLCNSNATQALLANHDFYCSK